MYDAEYSDIQISSLPISNESARFTKFEELWHTGKIKMINLRLVTIFLMPSPSAKS